MKVIDVLNKLAKGEKIQDFYIGGSKIKYRIIDDSIWRKSTIDETFIECDWYIFKDWLNKEVHFITNILDKEEKEYLSHVIKPFRKKVKSIVKWDLVDEYYIEINLIDDSIDLPGFKNKNMYKGMNPDKHYTLEELGL